MSNRSLTAEQIISRGRIEGFLPYGIAKLINIQLTELGLEEIRPQMMYNYDRNGLINGTKGQNSDRPYTEDETNKFVEKFVAMRTKKAAQAPKTPQTVEDIDAQVAALLTKKSELQGTMNA